MHVKCMQGKPLFPEFITNEGCDFGPRCYFWYPHRTGKRMFAAACHAQQHGRQRRRKCERWKTRQDTTHGIAQIIEIQAFLHLDQKTSVPSLA
eukprot:4733723-Amphidinium_carterae.1